MNSTDKQKFIRDQYNASASVYDARYGDTQREKFQIALSPAILRRLAGTLILDIGCGTGQFGAFLRELLPPNDAIVVGIDIAEEMLKQARASGVYQCVIADLGTMPIRPGAVRAAVSFTAFQNLPDWKAGVDVLFEVLAGGGCYLASILKKGVGAGEFFAYLERRSGRTRSFDITQVEDFIACGEKFE